MNDPLQLIGALSNDLFRVANSMGRNNQPAAVRFLAEAKRWAKPLQNYEVAPYVLKIARIIVQSNDEVTQHQAENYLMYGILLQNYAAHQMKSS